jgi:hypothetical protein
LTISSTTRIAGPFVGTGSASVFPFTFKVFAASNLNVIRLDSSTGVETTLVLTTDYTVTLNGNQNTNPGGSVTLVAGALASGFTLTITSDIANLQPTDLTNQGGFYPEVITDSLDRATIQIQQMADDLTRSIKTPISDGLALNMELPTAAQRANSFLAFDASGEPTTVTAGSSGAPATITRQVFSGTGSQTVFTLASDPGALGNSAQVYIGGVYQQRSTYTIAGTTLTFSAPPVAGTDNIEFVNFLTSNIGATSADLVTYTPAGSGAVARSAASKFGDTVSVKDFGAVGNGVADDTTAIQAAIDYATSIGGQTVACGGLTYKTTGPIIVKDDVKLDLQGGKILSVLSGSNDYGVRLRNRSEVCNGEIEVQSSGSPGSQAGIHAPLVIGPFYGDGGTVASPSVDEGVASWTARNLKLWTNRDGKVCIQVTGGANNGLIENIEAPSSSTLAGVVHLDWGFVGTINSANVTASRTNFDAGTAYTTHPNNVLIRNIKAGALTRTKSGVDTGSHLVRLSGVYNISVANVVATQCTYAAVRVTAGDLGFEFALAAVKPMGMRGIRWNGVSVQNTTDSWLVYCDSYADNVAAAVGGGYLPLIDPLMETDMVVDQVTGKGSGGASVTPGLYVIQIRGAKFTNINATGYSYGCLVDELVYNVKIHGTFYANRGHGIYIHHGTKKPEDVEILPQTYCYSNGQDSGFANPAGICVEGSIRCRIDGALLGNRTAANEGTQERGILLSTVTLPIDVEVENCHVFSVEAGGTAYALLGSTNYGYLKLFRNNTVESAVTNKIAGLNIIPINRFLGSDEVERAHYTAQRASLTLDITPTTGTWATGDLIFYSDPSSGNTGTRCETAGAPGTWAQF